MQKIYLDCNYMARNNLTYQIVGTYRQDTLSSSFVAGRTAAPGWKPGTGEFV